MVSYVGVKDLVRESVRKDPAKVTTRDISSSGIAYASVNVDDGGSSDERDRSMAVDVISELVNWMSLLGVICS